MSELRCPSCGEYALVAELALRDVQVHARCTPEGVALDLDHFGASVASMGCEACGDEIDLESGGFGSGDDETIASAIEGLVEDRLRRLGEDL